MNEVEIKIVSTIKIQSIENGKKTTRRRFNVDVALPKELKRIVDSYIGDVAKEIYAEKMSPEDWVKHIKKHSTSKKLRGWAASIIWFRYGGEEDTVLYKMSKDYDHRNNKLKVEQVLALLERMGCPRFISDDAASRERERTKEICDYIKKRKKLLKLGRQMGRNYV